MTRQRVNQISAALLAAGAIAAIVIFLTAKPPEPDDSLGRDPLADKKFRRELAVYGGKANVVSSDLMDWFASLWEGRTLGVTLAVIAVVTTLGFRFVAMPIEEPRTDAARPSEKKSG